LFLNSISKLVLNTKVKGDIGPEINVISRRSFDKAVFPLQCIFFLQHDTCRELLQKGLEHLSSSYFPEQIERTSADSRTSHNLPRIQNRHFINTDKALHVNISSKQATEPIRKINGHGFPDTVRKSS
jgi:hypothetical protein